MEKRQTKTGYVNQGHAPGLATDGLSWHDKLCIMYTIGCSVLVLWHSFKNCISQGMVEWNRLFLQKKVFSQKSGWKMSFPKESGWKLSFPKEKGWKESLFPKNWLERLPLPTIELYQIGTVNRIKSIPQKTLCP